MKPIIDRPERPSPRRPPTRERSARAGSPLLRTGFHSLGRFLLALAAALAAASSPPAAASLFERSFLTAEATAVGGALVSFAEGPASIFVNPAGLAVITGPGAYADYAEPRSRAGAREMRFAAAGDAGPACIGLGWYRLAGGALDEDVVAAGAARTLVSGTPGSYIAIGASAVFGRASAGSGPPDGRTESGMSADLGVVVRPLPVLSFAYAAGNVLRADIEAGDRSWSGSSRWGIAYFWENTFILSFARGTVGGDTKQHIGVSARAAVPVELMFGLSGGEAAGGVRWSGKRFRAGVSFSSHREGGVTWMVSCEGALFASQEDGRR